MYPEEEIIVKLQAKDERCVRMMFDNYYHSLCVYALRYLASVEDVEDIVQNVFISFWETKRGAFFEGSVRSYLYGAVSKSALKFLERNGHFFFDDIELHVNQFLEEMTLGEDEDLNKLKAILQREIERLPEKSREVFNAIVLDNLSYKQAAERFQVSVNTVKTHYSHALKKLRENLGDLFILVFFLNGFGC